MSARGACLPLAASRAHQGEPVSEGRAIMAAIPVGVFPPFELTSDLPATRTYLERAAAAGLDHVCCGDHVSFFVGAGNDGLLEAAILTALHPSMPVRTAVYLLPLRHPVLVARQLADIARRAPGRLVFGVGVGGEDRHEVASCGVDPATRGKRMDECLAIVRALLTGEAVTFTGRFFDLDRVLIAPPPAMPIPIVIGGRSDAALRRAGRLGDGWLGIWNSPRRFAEATAIVAAEADRARRLDPPRQHAMQVWCGIADTVAEARGRLAPAMEAFYQTPFERFERYCPCGPPEVVAEFLASYVAAGCTSFNLIPRTPDLDTAIEGAAAIKRALATA
jgi:alkanesulfonate monooxygenase SsuD/methylene tetrahydromethanopterin reductase-like flavin-dependent oxidoreductase (luciferase family)